MPRNRFFHCLTLAVMETEAMAGEPLGQGQGKDSGGVKPTAE